MIARMTVPITTGLLAVGLFLTAASPADARQGKMDPRTEQLIKSINWKPGPFKAKLGSVAEVDVPAGYLFVEQNDMAKYAELNQNPHNPNSLGALMPQEKDTDWVILFQFEDTGYVKDDEKDKLDADAILDSIRQGTEAANETRKTRGWAPLNINGWEQKPFYDNDTKNLSWAIRATSDGRPVINYNSRILGRRGVMSANLIVGDSQELQRTLPTYKKLLGGYTYIANERYSEFRSGDKVAAYGLAALIGGGVAAAAAKSGLLGKLLKPIIVGVVVVVSAIGGLFKKIFGRGQPAQEG
jgi:uncharacterized membrane-anchored protein